MYESHIFRTSFVLLAFLGCFCLSLFINDNAFAADEDKIGYLSIVSDGSGEFYGTHSFLYFYNTSKKNVSINGYVVAPNKGITIGTFGNKSEGKGVYVNLEAFFIYKYGAYENRVSLTTSISESQLKTMNSTIKNSNKWTTYYNCSWFAEKVWNSVAPSSRKVNAGRPSTPATLSKCIKNNALCWKKIDIYYDNNDTWGYCVYRFNSEGKYVKTCDESKKSSSSAFSSR